MQAPVQTPSLTAEQINARVRDLFGSPNLYWQIDKPAETLRLSGSLYHVIRNYRDAQGSDRFVYWPDYKVAGTIKNIVNAFRNAGINQVQVGGLYGITSGQVGCYRRLAH